MGTLFHLSGIYVPCYHCPARLQAFPALPNYWNRIACLINIKIYLTAKMNFCCSVFIAFIFHEWEKNYFIHFSFFTIKINLQILKNFTLQYRRTFQVLVGFVSPAMRVSLKQLEPLMSCPGMATLCCYFHP